MSGKVMVVLDWKAGGTLKENLRFLEGRGLAGAVRPRNWRTADGRFRSLVVWSDGTCQLQRLSVAAAAGRLGKVQRVRNGRGTRGTA